MGMLHGCKAIGEHNKLAIAGAVLSTAFTGGVAWRAWGPAHMGRPGCRRGLAVAWAHGAWHRAVLSSLCGPAAGDLLYLCRLVPLLLGMGAMQRPAAARAVGCAGLHAGMLATCLRPCQDMPCLCPCLCQHSTSHPHPGHCSCSAQGSVAPCHTISCTMLHHALPCHCRCCCACRLLCLDPVQERQGKRLLLVRQEGLSMSRRHEPWWHGHNTGGLLLLGGCLVTTPWGCCQNAAVWLPGRVGLGAVCS